MGEGRYGVGVDVCGRFRGVVRNTRRIAETDERKHWSTLGNMTANVKKMR